MISKRTVLREEAEQEMLPKYVLSAYKVCETCKKHFVRRKL